MHTLKEKEMTKKKSDKNIGKKCKTKREKVEREQCECFSCDIIEGWKRNTTATTTFQESNCEFYVKNSNRFLNID